MFVVVNELFVTPQNRATFERLTAYHVHTEIGAATERPSRSN
jgi:hypothetical protein